MIMTPSEGSYSEESKKIKGDFNGHIFNHMVNAFVMRSNVNSGRDEELKNIYSNFGLGNPQNESVNVNDGYIYNRNGFYQSLTDNACQDISDQKLKDQLTEQVQNEKYLNIFREHFNSHSTNQSINKLWSPHSLQTNIIESSPINYNFNRRHNSFNIVGDKTSCNGFNSLHANLFDVSNGLENQSQFNEQINNRDQNIRQNIFDYRNSFSNSLECLDQSCRNKIQQGHDQSLVRFQCTNCHSIQFMHQCCFVKKSRPNNRRNSCNSFLTKPNEIHIACTNCNGFLKTDTSFYSPHFLPRPENKTVDLNNNNVTFKQGSTKTKFNKNIKSQLNQKIKVNNIPQSSTGYRKKSLGINPPLPIPMQSLRESRSPSPISPAILSNKRLSVPVNMPKNRFRTVSTGSTGSFTPSLSFSPKQGSLSNIFSSSLNMNDLSANFEEKLAQSGNIFHTRKDWSVLKKVPLEKQNSIHIRLEDEGPYGNDETRCFLLSHFSTLGIRAMSCVLCRCQLNIYDRFPLIDGTFYSSPLNYSNNTQQLEIDPKNPDTILSVSAIISKKKQSIYAMCLSCLNMTPNHVITCHGCKKPWTGGAHIQIGTMYRYEIFAAFPCCESRFTCKKCRTVIAGSENLKHFSSYSEEVTCPKCNDRDYHFIKPLETFYKTNLC